MKQLRQYIRQVLLTEGMKTPADLPENIVVVIDPESVGVEIYYGLSQDPDNRPGTGDLAKGSVSIFSLKGLHLGDCGDAWMVGGSWAESGWGPLLYDIAIEWATQNGGGLISDRATVSGDARNVWSYYMSDRSDVTAHQLDDPFNSLTPAGEDNCDQEVAGGRHTMYGGERDRGSEWVKSALSKRYTKSPTTMDALRRIGKLVER